MSERDDEVVIATTGSEVTGVATDAIFLQIDDAPPPRWPPRAPSRVNPEPRLTPVMQRAPRTPGTPRRPGLLDAWDS